MNRFEFLSHTADIRMYVEASTLEELFSVALRGMNALLDTNSQTKHAFTQVYPLHLTSLDKTTLLIDFLSDVLTGEYEMKTIFGALHMSELTDSSLKAELRGYLVKQFDEDIKAVTYHEAEVIRNSKGNWETVVIFDI